MSRFFYYLIFIVFLSFYHCGKEKPTRPDSSEKTGSISGHVINAQDSSAVKSALINITPGDLSVNTDQNGFYTVTDLAEGHYLVIVSKENFMSDSSDVFLQADQNKTVNFALARAFNPLIWEFITDKPVYYSTPAIDDDGTIYVGTGVYLGTNSGSLYAVNPDGTQKWKYDLDNNATSPVIGQDGTIYIMDTKNILYAFNRAGNLLWRYEDWIKNDFAEVGQRPVAIGYDNTLYVYVGFDLYAINPDGTRKWLFDPQRSGTPCGASPAVGKDSTIYVILGDNILYAIHPDGTLKWEFYLETFNEHSYTSITLDADNVIYFGTENNSGGYLYAVYPTGILKWRVLAGTERPVRASPVIGLDGTVYVATKAYSHNRPAEIVAVTAEGSILWKYVVESVHFTPDDVYTTATVGDNGLIYTAAETGFVYALNPDGTLNWKYDSQGGINWSSPTLTKDGILYIGAMKNEGGALIALQTQSQGVASSPWPTFRQNNKNTGRSDEFLR